MAEESGELIKTTTSDAPEALMTGEFADDADETTALTKTEIASETTEAADDEVTDETEQLREQIVETRRGMGETIDAIQEKLSFANISEQVQTQVSEQISGAVETAKDVFYDKAGEIVNTVSKSFKQIGGTDLAKRAQQNPTATALIGAGVGALLVTLLVGGKKRKKQKAYDYDYDYKAKTQQSTRLSFADDDDEVGSRRDLDNEDDDDVRYADSSRRELLSNTAMTASAANDKSNESGESTLQSARKRVGDTASSAYETVSSATGAAYDGVTGAANSAYETLGSAAGKTYEGVGSAANKTYQGVTTAAGFAYDKAGDLGGQVKINYEHYIEENPLAVGAVALALGAAVGFAIPLTKKENEYLGEYRDQVVEKAQEAAQDAIGSVKQLATDAQKVIAEEVKSKTA